jgi:hypothetical protein
MMAKLEVKGAIYRIRKSGPAKVLDRWESSTARIWQLAQRKDGASIQGLVQSLQDHDPSVAPTP